MIRPAFKLLSGVLLAAAPALSATKPAGTMIGNIGTGPGATVSIPMQVVIMLTVMTLLPAIVMSITPFLRISIVLHFLRQAIGTQTVPSNQVLIGLSLFLSIVIMQPVMSEVYQKGWEPFDKGELSMNDAMSEGSKPMKAFLSRFTRERDVKMFLEISHAPAPKNAKDLDLSVLVPAYITSELKAGFQIGAVLFLPFLVIDLVVASVTLSIGMVQLPPVMISAPFKILLFVLVDGWNLIIGSLMKSFY
jgi:flagellar biosynthetic protein FliP